MRLSAISAIWCEVASGPTPRARYSGGALVAFEADRARAERVDDLAAERRVVLLVREARLLPHVVARELLVDRERGDQVDARVAVVLRLDEQRTRRFGDVLAARRARFERIALDLRVVVEHEALVLLVEVAPVVARAEHEQVVVAQAVGDRLAVVALQERLHGRVRRVHARAPVESNNCGLIWKYST